MRSRCRRCFCMNNNYSNMPIKCKQDVIETGCNDLSCSNSNYNEACSCGFDDDEIDVFPNNPSLGQSYVPIQTMEETFKPCARIKMRNYFSRIS